jgi:uncharacterized protein (DUF4415 family)
MTMDNEMGEQPASETASTEEATTQSETTERRRRPGQRGAQKGGKKQQVTLRLDQSVLAAYRSQGAGWQTTLNDDLRRLAKRRKLRAGEALSVEGQEEASGPKRAGPRRRAAAQAAGKPKAAGKRATAQKRRQRAAETQAS